MTIPQRTRVLIVDDSAVMRSLLRSVVGSDPLLDVAGTAVNGADALEAVKTLQPELILLDVEMPVMDGLETLRRLQAEGCPTPVIMCSALTQRGARVTVEALSRGAADYVTKPAQQASREQALARLAAELLPKVHVLTRRRTEERKAPAAPRAAPSTILEVPRVLAIGVSTGGPVALERVLPALPSNFPLPVLVVQHMPELFTQLLADRLDSLCRIRVRGAVDGAVIRAGEVVIARGDWHLEVKPAGGGTMLQRISQGPTENHCRPSVDVLFRSCGTAYGAQVLAVVMTGMGSDGLAGCRALRKAGATVLAQDEASSAVWGMPGAVAQAGLAQRVVALDEMAGEILRLVNGRWTGVERLTEATA